MEFVARVNALFRRLELSRAHVKPEYITFDNFTLNTEARQAEVDGHPLDLTPTEYEMMLYFLKNSEREVSRE